MTDSRPPLFFVGHPLHYRSDEWGYRNLIFPKAERPRSGGITIRQILLRTATSDADDVERAARPIEDALPDWRSLALSWITTLGDEPVPQKLPSRDTMMAATRPWSVGANEHWHDVPLSSPYTTSEALPTAWIQADLTKWGKALGYASAGTELPVPHELMLSSLMALVDGKPRLALFDAATAAEIAIESALDDRLSEQLERPWARAVLDQVWGIAQRMDFGLALGLDFGRKQLKSQLFDPRNSALHKNSLVDAATVSVALNAAREVLKRFVALPDVVPADVEQV